MAFQKKIQRFYLSDCTLNDKTDGTSADLSGSLAMLAVKDEYFDNCYPLYDFTLSVTNDIRKKIRDDDVSIHVRMSVYEPSTDSDSSDSGSDMVSETDTLIDTTVYIYSKPYFSNDSAKDTESDSQSDEDTKEKSVPYYSYEVAGVPEDILAYNEPVINEILGSAKVSDAIIYILNQAGVREISMDNPDNDARYDSLVITPSNPVPALRQIEDRYGVYSTGKMGIFFEEAGKAYVFDVLSDHNSSNAVVLTVKSSANEADDTKFYCPEVDDDGNVNIYKRAEPIFESNKEIDYDSFGSDEVMCSYDDLYAGTSRTYSNDEASKKKVRYYWNPQRDRIFETSYIYAAKKSIESANIAISDINPNYFQVDSSYSINSQGRTAGRYALLSKTYALSTSDRKHYSSTVNLTFTKIG